MSDTPTPEPTPPAPEPISFSGVLRSLIAAIVASINTHCFQGEVAAPLVAEAHAAIGDELTDLEHEHLDKVFSEIQKGPAPSKVFPQAPAIVPDDEPTAESHEVGEPTVEEPVYPEPTPHPEHS